MTSNTRKQLEDWLGKIDVKADKVLDVGGIKNSIKGRTKTWDVKEFKSLDYQKNPDYKYDLNYKIDAIPQFDIVFCLEVMEYIWNPVQVLENLNNFLKDGGILYVSFHFLFPHHQPKETDSLRYTRSGIEKLLTNIGFQIIEMVPRKTINQGALSEFLSSESKIVYHNGDIGYLIKAIKYAKVVSHHFCFQSASCDCSPH